MGHRDRLAFHHVDTHGGRIQQHVHQVVVQQVHLVHVQKVAIGLRQHARLESAGSAADGRFQVDGPHQAVLGCVDGEVDDPHRYSADGERTVLGTPAAVGAPGLRCHGVTAVVAALHGVVVGQQARQPPHGGRLGRPPLPADEDAPDLRMDGVQQQSPLHRVLGHDRREWQRRPERH